MTEREARGTRLLRGRRGFVSPLTILAPALLLLTAEPASPAVVCETVDGPPGEEVTLHLEIGSPDQGHVFETGACELPVTVSGTYFVDEPERPIDFYIVVDTSGSTGACSGANVNENQVLCDDDGSDSIYQAEMVAAQKFLEKLDPATSRAALITFSDIAVLHEPLTSNLTRVWNTLELLRGGSDQGGTEYVPPLNMIRDQVDACPDCAGREQRGLFLSDGEPNGTDGIAEAARQLAARGVVVDTFRLGDFLNPAMLILISDITGGTYYPLATPGEILLLLPEIAVQYRFSSRNDGTGEHGRVTVDRNAGTWEVPAILRVGDNRIVIILNTLGGNPITLECPIDLVLRLARPAGIGSALRVRKGPGWPNHLQLDWQGAPGPVAGQDYRVFRSADRQGPFGERDRTTDREIETQHWPLDRVDYYDVRAGNCNEDVSLDPFPPTTAGLAHCWTPPELPLLYPLASNLTDPACANIVSSYPCAPPPPDLSGAERTFTLPVQDPGEGLRVRLSNPDLYAIVYGPAGSCLGWGQTIVEIDTVGPGDYSIVVDAPAGSEGPFDVMAERR